MCRMSVFCRLGRRLSARAEPLLDDARRLLEILLSAAAAVVAASVAGQAAATEEAATETTVGIAMMIVTTIPRLVTAVAVATPTMTLARCPCPVRLYAPCFVVGCSGVGCGYEHGVRGVWGAAFSSAIVAACSVAAVAVVDFSTVVVVGWA